MSERLNIEALYEALHIALGALCDGRVYPLVAPAKDTPYITYSFTAGGSTDRRKRENSTLILTVKCVSNDLIEALAGGRDIRDLLRDKGDQESTTLPTDTEWRITTVTQGALIHYAEEWQSGEILYHAGHDYTFTMERRTDG